MNSEIIEKPKILQAIELIMAKPENIKNESTQLIEKLRKSNPERSEIEIRKIASKKIISNYSYYSAFSGGTTALTGIIPGIGTAVAITGGASADAIASMKFQIEMTMAIATVYNHNILLEEEKRLCYIIAGLGVISEATKKGAKIISSRAFIKLAQNHLKGATLAAIKEIFKK